MSAEVCSRFESPEILSWEILHVEIVNPETQVNL